MMEIVLITLVVLICLALVWNSCDRDGAFEIGLLLITLSFLFTVCLDSYFNRDTPNAMNVYQGKTTLEITYRDSIAIDSVVVYKPEFRKK